MACLFILIIMLNSANQSRRVNRIGKVAIVNPFNRQHSCRAIASFNMPVVTIIIVPQRMFAAQAFNPLKRNKASRAPFPKYVSLKNGDNYVETRVYQDNEVLTTFNNGIIDGLKLEKNSDNDKVTPSSTIMMSVTIANNELRNAFNNHM